VRPDSREALLLTLAYAPEIKIFGGQSSRSLRGGYGRNWVQATFRYRVEEESLFAGTPLKGSRDRLA